MSSSGTDDPPGGKMHFRRMDQGTDADYEVLEAVHVRNMAALPDLLLGMLTDLDGDANYPIDRLQHSLQTATRATRDGADEEMIVCALFHDVGESLGPLNHGEVVAAILRPFISDANYWMLVPPRAVPDVLLRPPPRARSERPRAVQGQPALPADGGLHDELGRGVLRS